jgi:hypothetical protein
MLREMDRDWVEKELNFAGFLVFHSPLKPDSAEAVRELHESMHRVGLPCRFSQLLTFCADHYDYRGQSTNGLPYFKGIVDCAQTSFDS